ncbi:MAG: hypothetical protein U5L00_11215 [Desulfovermiculus sp.]|nr:hypothetical protein [Desulfovermiculus sp.]
MNYATDDLAARQLASTMKVSITGTLGILITLVRYQMLELKEANAMLASMINKNFRSPVNQLDEYI